jgi:hypothetical protein
MARRRPTVIILLGILQLVGGGVGLFCCTGCGGLLQISNAHIDVLQGKNLPSAGGPAAGGSTFQQSTQLATRIDLQLVKAVPSYKPYTILNVLVSFILDCLLIISGIGLLMMAGWGRILAIGYACFSLLTKLLFAVYLFVFVFGPISTIMDQELVNPPPQLGTPVAVVRISRLSRDFAWLFCGIYPMIVLGILLHPAVRKAFTARSERSDEAEDAPRRPIREEYEDDRRRHSEREDDDRYY